MKRGFKAWVCALGTVALALEIHASINPGAVSDSPYSIISVRNVFDLREPPVINTSTNSVTPPSNIKLTGLTTLFGYKQAVFAVTEHGKPQPITIVLAEGERQNGVELVSVDMGARTANIKNDDRPEFLRLDEKAGGAAGGAPVAAANPALGGRGVVPPTQAPGNQFAYGGGARGAAPNAGPASAFNPQGTPQASPNAYGQATPAAFGQTAATAGAPDQITNPYGTNPLNPTPTRQVRTDNTPILTPEQQVILIEAQRAQALQTGNPIAAILPPTPLTSTIQSENQPTAQQAAPTFPATPGAPLGSKSTGTLQLPGR